MPESIAVLSSGGLDSCILLADMALESTVYPIYVRNGFIWEQEEFRALNAFIQALNNRNVQQITTLSLPIHALYGNHWSLSGSQVPSVNDPDSKTFLPGRNVLLLSVAGVWCSLHQVPRIAIGTLHGNAFPDATIEFFKQFGKTLSAGLDFKIGIEVPYRKKYGKKDLIQKYKNLPLELTLSCIDPKGGKHCGQCNKCGERQAGYKAAGVRDQTQYVKACSKSPNDCFLDLSLLKSFTI
jgi:7-cyano-7-deazaguanine synthase